MLFVIFLGLLILGIIFRNNKYLFVIQLCFIAFIIGGAGDSLADYPVYFNKFTNVSSNRQSNEWFFNLFLVTCKSTGMSYYGFRIVVGILYSVVVGFVSIKMSKNNFCFVVSMLMIYPFCIDSVQLRQTLAMLFGILAFERLFNRTRKLDIFLALIFLILAGGMHASTYLYLLLVPIFFIRNRNKFVLYCIISVIVLFVITSNSFEDIAEVFVSADKAELLEEKAIGAQFKYYILLIVISLLPIIPYLNDVNKKRNISSGSLILVKMNIAMIVICIPLMMYKGSFYRIQQVLLIFNYAAVSNYLVANYDKSEINISNFKYSIHSIVVSFVSLYMLVLSSPNLYTVFWPLFNDNIFA